jgi:hypothetical protein
VKLNSVNVVEYVNGSLAALYAFSDDTEGNKEAEAVFRKCAEDNDFDEESIALGLEDGSCSHSDSDYQLFIIHSQDGQLEAVG